MFSRVRHRVSYSGTAPGRQPAAVLKLCPAALAGLLLAACSVLSPLSRSGDGDMVTGSISPKQPEPADRLMLLDTRLDPEDLRRARAAFATALDPQGSGAAVRWDNPDSGAKGSVAAVGSPYLQGDTICRNFVASAHASSPESWRQGSACRQGPGEWDIREMKPWRQPG